MALSFTRATHSILKVHGSSTANLLFKPAVLAGMQQSVRTTINKHFNPKFRKHRAAKYIKVELPDFEADRRRDDMTPDQIRAKLKEKGVIPPRPWSERPFCVSCTGAVFEPYIPPEGDGKMSTVSVQGAKQKLVLLEKKSKSMMAIRKIRTYEEDFDVHEFAQQALEIYIAAHEAMASDNKLKLREFVTERAYPEIRNNTFCKTIHWKYHGSLEPARVVHGRVTDVITRDNLFAQITVRLHTQQTLCIWDRFGRLEFGATDAVRDVLEYIVFEKHISNQYGTWRLHDKIIPEWLPLREPAKRTFVQPIISETDQVTSEVETVTTAPETTTTPVPA